MENNITLSEKNSTILNSIFKVNEELGKITATGWNNFQRYKYVSEADILNAIKDLCLKNGLIPIFNEEANKTYINQSSDKGYTSEITVSLTLYHISGEWIKICTTGLGNDSGDKSIYKAITGARKYLYRNIFMIIAGGEDPEDDIATPQKKEVVRNNVAKTEGKLQVNTAKPIAPATPKLTSATVEVADTVDAAEVITKEKNLNPPLDPIDNLTEVAKEVFGVEPLDPIVSEKIDIAKKALLQSQNKQETLQIILKSVKEKKDFTNEVKKEIEKQLVNFVENELK